MAEKTTGRKTQTPPGFQPKDKDQEPAEIRKASDVPYVQDPPARANIVERVENSPLKDVIPDHQKDPQGATFYNPALVGSGTIMPDGTYGAPLPDPLLLKRQEDPEVTTDLKDADPNPPAQRTGE